MKSRLLLVLAPLLVLGALAWPASAQSRQYTAVVTVDGNAQQTHFSVGTHPLFEGGGWQCMARVVRPNIAAIGCRRGNGHGFSSTVRCRLPEERRASVMVFERGRDAPLADIQLRCE